MFENIQIRKINEPKMFRRKKNPFERIIFESAESGRVFTYLHDSNSMFRARGIN